MKAIIFQAFSKETGKMLASSKQTKFENGKLNTVFLTEDQLSEYVSETFVDSFEIRNVEI